MIRPLTTPELEGFEKHDEVVLEIPFAPEGVPKRIEGKPAVVESTTRACRT